MPVRTTFLFLMLILSGCRNQQPQAPSAEQSQQLNDAEDMLNSMSANQEGPANRSAGPSNQSN